MFLLSLIAAYFIGATVGAVQIYLRETKLTRGTRKDLLAMLAFLDEHDNHPALQWVDIAGVHAEIIVLDELLAVERKKIVRNTFWVFYAVWEGILWAKDEVVWFLGGIPRDPHSHLDLGKIREEEGRRL